MSKKNETNTRKSQKTPIRKIKKVGGITEYLLTSNGLRILFAPRKGTNVVTSNIVYFVGSRDEARGETGIAHMFEHMLFKPTSFDASQKKEKLVWYLMQILGKIVRLISFHIQKHILIGLCKLKLNACIMYSCMHMNFLPSKRTY